MRKEKEQVIELRKERKSYREIESVLGVPRSTLSGWLRGESWSSEVKKELVNINKEKSRQRIDFLNVKRKEKLKLLYQEARTKAAKEFLYLKHSPLFIAGIVSYWGEGDKTSKGNLKLSNTDPIMIKSFIHFLKRVCSIKEEKIRCGLLLYPDLDEYECRQYWSQKIGLPIGNFTKTMVIKGRKPAKILHHGICNVVVSSRYLKEKMLIWLNLLREEFDN